MKQSLLDAIWGWVACNCSIGFALALFPVWSEIVVGPDEVYGNWGTLPEVMSRFPSNVSDARDIADLAEMHFWNIALVSVITTLNGVVGLWVVLCHRRHQQ
jgi:hypothetical protein